MADGGKNVGIGSFDRRRHTLRIRKCMLTCQELRCTNKCEDDAIAIAAKMPGWRRGAAEWASVSFYPVLRRRPVAAHVSCQGIRRIQVES